MKGADPGPGESRQWHNARAIGYGQSGQHLRHSHTQHWMKPLRGNISQRNQHKRAVLHAWMRQDQRVRRCLTLIRDRQIHPVGVTGSIRKHLLAQSNQIKVKRPWAPSLIPRSTRVRLNSMKDLKQINS